MNDGHFTKSDAGRDEIKRRSRALSRPARNLLLIMDGTRRAADWQALVHGASEADLRQLLAEGLVVAVKEPAPSAAPVGRATLADALGQLGYEQLYTLITSQAKDRLGLLQGFKLVLEVERCADVNALRTLAVRFLDQVKQRQGDAAARTMRLALGATG